VPIYGQCRAGIVEIDPAVAHGDVVEFAQAVEHVIEQAGPDEAGNFLLELATGEPAAGGAEEAAEHLVFVSGERFGGRDGEEGGAFVEPDDGTHGRIDIVGEVPEGRIAGQEVRRDGGTAPEAFSGGGEADGAEAGAFGTGEDGFAGFVEGLVEVGEEFDDGDPVRAGSGMREEREDGRGVAEEDWRHGFMISALGCPRDL
jgi:hypothetical protein